MQQKTTTWPVIATSQNGSGVAAQMLEYFDTYSNLIWKMDERGYITGMTYDIPTGALIQQIDDVNTSLVSAPSGWTTPADGGLHLITDFEHDAQGRQIQSLGPWHTIDIGGVATSIRRATWTVYQDATFQTWQGQGYATAGSSSSSASSGSGSPTTYTFTLINPVAIAITDAQDRATDQIQSVRYAAGNSSSNSLSSSGCPTTAPLTTSGALSALDTFPQCSYVRWATTQYSDCCLAASRRVYKLIPPTGIGTSATNYDETDFGYDVMKRQNRVVSPGGTITRTVFEARGLPIGTWVGTNDTGATATNPAGSGAPNNMVQVSGMVYDGGSAGGDGNVSQDIKYVDATRTNDRLTSFLYDFRNRRTDTDGEIDFYAKRYFDNLDRVYRQERYDTSLAGNLIMLSTQSFDDRGAAFQAARYGVDPSTGTIGNALIDNTWRDASRHVVKSLPAGSQLFTKTVIDSLGRDAVKYTGYGTDASYADIFSVANDVILEQTETTYDAANNGIQTTQRLRYHNAAASQLSALGDPSTTPHSRVTYSAIYFDALGRPVATADYGTNGGIALTRSATIPARSDICLVNSTTFNARGEDYLATDTAGTVTYQSFDDVGRRLTLIENYIATSSSSSSSSSSNSCAASDDKNRTTTFTFTADGVLATISAVNATTGNQTTTYQYGTTLSDSAIASSLLKRYEIYPDSVGGSDQKAFTYNRQSQVTTLADQNGTVHSFDFDLLGRQTADRITTAGAGVDTAVLRISKTYEVRGLVQNITSYDNATVGQGNVVNDVQKTYNTFGQLVTEYQSHSGAVNVASTPKVQYAHADGSANTIRPTSMTYPNGRLLNYDYGTSGGINDSASRIASFIDHDGVTHLADYSYLGRNSIVQFNEPQPGIQYTLVGIQGGNDPDTGDIYRGLDRFSRVTDLTWVPMAGSSSSSSSSSSAAGTNLVRIQHGYDRSGNRLWRKDLVAEAYGAEFDELYSYDGLYRLKSMQRGTLNFSQTAIQNPDFAQCWSLDSTGNWRNFREDDTGSGFWDLVQNRSANTVNEITAITNTVGSAWTQPAYNAAGNMTTMPQPATPTAAYTATYDAWTRLVKLVDHSGNTVQTNAYDGRRYRTIRNGFVAGVLSETRHFIYTAAWQTIEERIGVLTTPNCQFVWGRRYIDDLLLRDRDPNGAGTLTERLFAFQDPNWNVIVSANAAGDIQERYDYSAYGSTGFMTSSFVDTLLSFYAFETLYCGYRFDPHVGLYLARNRLLHIQLGSWLSRDSLSRQLGDSMYQYVMSRSINLTDPSGNQAAKPAPPKPIEFTFDVCCTFDRFCTNCVGFGYGPETRKEPHSCKIPAGKQLTIENLSIAANECCAANKPLNNWFNIYTRCSYWMSFGTVGGCRTPQGKSDCFTELSTFLHNVNNWINGPPPGEASPNADQLNLDCKAFCECIYGQQNALVKICIADGFCKPVLGAAGVPQ
ncbi:MAG: hypothetical protein HY290_03680 [Planctomycetia bacterium]|nr:hypothetical protein [Planctomycetia bacterium]